MNTQDDVNTLIDILEKLTNHSTNRTSKEINNDWDTARTILKEMKSRPKPVIGDGYMQNPGYMPVNRDCYVDVIFRDNILCSGEARSYDWGVDDSPSDIIKYRIVKF